MATLLFLKDSASVGRFWVAVCFRLAMASSLASLLIEARDARASICTLGAFGAFATGSFLGVAGLALRDETVVATFGVATFGSFFAFFIIPITEPF